MTGKELWSFEAAVAAIGGVADGQATLPVTGISIDTRSLQPGELFVALKDARDGHEFVTNAFVAGASAALVNNSYVRKLGDGALIRVEDVLRGLENLGKGARQRLSSTARVIGVTGSAGKTGTKEMLRACFAQQGVVHAAEKSFNNHWGVPLTLSRMPQDTDFGIFEIGMNHPGEIRPLAKQVAPHVAIVTTVEPVHLAQFSSVAEIAQEKAEIFEGVTDGGTAIVNIDSPHFAALAERAKSRGLKIVKFGFAKEADVRASSVQLEAEGSEVAAIVDGKTYLYRLAIPGAHIVRNSLAVIAAVQAVSGDVELAAAALGNLMPGGGRGERTLLAVRGGKALLIDESYNANPASMRAALDVLGSVSRRDYGRRIAVLGDMLELGPDAAELHRGLHSAIESNAVDIVMAAGPMMRHLIDSLPSSVTSLHAAHSKDLAAPLADLIVEGDAVMIKGSFGSRMGPLVSLLKERFAGPVAKASSEGAAAGHAG